MKKMLKRFIKDERGLEASEYALLLAIICVLVVVAIIALKDRIILAFQEATAAMDGTPPS
jgi:Flp pilus assembly pilin Flp